MALMMGHSQGVINENIREMMHAGHPQNQAIAASMKAANKSRALKKKKLVPKKDTDDLHEE